MDQISYEDQETKRRRDAGRLQVTERDTIVLTWIAEQFCIAFDQLQQLLGHHAKATTKKPDLLSISATRDIIDRWLQLGLIEEPRKILTGYAPHIWLSRRGLSQLTLPYTYYKPTIANVKHFYAVNAIRLHFEKYQLQSLWYPERALTRDTADRPTPDAELRVIDIGHTAIKVLEAPVKHDITISDTLDTLKILISRYSSLWCFLSLANIDTLQQAIATLDQKAQQRITLYGLDTQELKRDTISIPNVTN